ncbi:hypothetical protein [Jeongeupia sp. HS-3]|uniref:hypothetical protein n=1 Tax=Jeongeupia sp. HS-3 TaxID=1009682 RepID=UPI0019109091|nr:hypothetical protein [Jeongeupia sp. HS-3]
MRTDPVDRILAHEYRALPEPPRHRTGGWNGIERRSGEDRRDGDDRRLSAQQALLDTRGSQDRRRDGRRATDSAQARSISLKV